MSKNQSSDANDMQLEEKRSYDALIELVEEAKKHLDNLKTDPEPKRPDIPPGIPQSILPILRKIEQQSQVVKNLLRVPVRPSGAKSKKVEEETKRKRDDPAEENMAVTRTMERQKMKDKLDELGTNLWNRTLLIHRVTKMAREVARQIHDDHSRKQTRQDALAQWDKLFAYTRNAAYSLIQVAGDDRRGVVRFVTRGLELATKTALALFAAGEHEESREVLSSAAELEDILVKKLQKGLDGLSEDQLFRQDCSKHVIEYYLARCSFEVGRDNETLAGTLMMKALSHCNATPNDVPPRSYQHITRKCHEIGSILLSRIDTQVQAAKDKKTGELAVAAAQWFKNGIQLVEAKDGEGEVAKMLAPFKSPLLEGLARASLLSLDKDPDALDRAQTITNDLMKSPDTVDRSKMQTFLMINVQILRRKNAPSPEIMKVMERLIDLQDWDDHDAVDKLLVEIDQPAADPQATIALYRYCLFTSLKDAEDSRRKHASRILFALVVFLQKQQSTFFAGPELQRALEVVSAAEDYQLETSPAVAITTMIWKTADTLSRNTGAKSQAAEWFVAGAHPAFIRTLGKVPADKFRRRAALCYLEVKDHAKAEAMLWQCDSGEADTRYMQFLLALDMGQIEQACDRATKLGGASDCSKRHLTLAIQSAVDSTDQAVMKATMRTLLAFKPRESEDSSSEAITLLRALIRLYLKDVDVGPTYKYANIISANTATILTNLNRDSVVREVLTLFQQAVEICRKLQEASQLVVYAKDCAWLYKTAYNLAIQGMSSWENTDSILACFGVAVDLMRIYHNLQGVTSDSQLPQQMLMGLHACLCGYVFAARSTESNEQRTKLWQWARTILAEHRTALDRCPSPPAEIRAQAFILEVEILGSLKQWEEIIALLQSRQAQSLPLPVCEAVADISFQHGVPVAGVEFPNLYRERRRAEKSTVTYVLQTLALKIATDSNQSSIVVLRWLRSVIDLLIHRKDSGDLENALQHIERARNIAQSKLNEVQDSEELEWLLATTWNQGLDYINLSNIGQAKAWLEQAIGFCSLTTNGEARLGQMRNVYNKVLAIK